jgi:hypothetical protein
MQQRILLLPGSSPSSHNNYKEVYTTIERGARERYQNNLVKESDIKHLAKIHRKKQSRYHTEVVNIEGLDNHVKNDAAQQNLSQYWDTLFRLFYTEV